MFILDFALTSCPEVVGTHGATPEFTVELWVGIGSI